MKKWTTSSDKAMKTGPSDEMKPEPLTKEKIKEEVLNRIKSKYDKSIYEPIILFDSCDVIVDELFDIIKQRLNWILKEIEKEKEQIENLKPIYNDYGNYEDWTCPICKIHFKEETKAYEHVEWEKRELRKTKGKMLNWFEDLIKKAFEGVVRE